MYQCANKVMSDGPGLVDFAVGVVNSALSVLGNSKYRRSVINPAQQVARTVAHDCLKGVGRESFIFPFVSWQNVREVPRAKCLN